MSATTLRVILAGRPHVWCEEYGWPDPATHGDEPIVTRDVTISD